MAMKLIRQPKDSNLCGQACVAMLAGVTLAEAIDACGTNGKTNTRIIRSALSTFGIRSAARRKRWGGHAEGTVLLAWCSWDGKRRHWTVYHDGKHYDPAAGTFRKPPKYLEENGRITSYLGLTLPEDGVPLSKDQRKLTDDERRAFLVKLSNLLSEYGVEISLYETYFGYEATSTIEVTDHWGHELMNRSSIDPHTIQEHL